MSADGFVGYDALIAELRRLNAERRTGVLFIATADNHGGQVALQEGHIVAVRFRRKVGLEAARDLRTARTVRFTFTRELAAAADPRLSPSAAWSAVTDVAGPNGHDDSHGMHTILTAALAEYLGPMAAIVVRDQLRDAESAGRHAIDVVEALARGVDDPAAAAAFREQATAALAARAARRP
jgi:hypothetical protein